MAFLEGAARLHRLSVRVEPIARSGEMGGWGWISSLSGHGTHLCHTALFAQGG